MSIPKSPIAVLIADDDPLFRDMAVACLEGAGMTADTAADGAAAMAMLADGAYHLAIIDLVMPRIDGLRLIALVRSTPHLRSLPILMVTAQQDPRLIDDGWQVGANGCVIKPVDWATLPSKVRALVAPEP